MTPRYDTDPLAGDWKRPKNGRSQPLEADNGLVVEEVATGWVGAIVAVEKAGGMYVVHLEDRRGVVKAFPLGPGFLVDGRPVSLTPPKKAAIAKLQAARPDTSRTASGSRAVAGAQARVARSSRILVEGRHDAELVEKVWGEDLRLEGVVVELLEGVDNLPAYVEAFAPDASRRLGVLVDHLVAGAKESKIVEQVTRGRYGTHVHVLGHPYVDVWQAVKPARLGWERWPVIPRGTSWKHGILAELGWPRETQADVAQGWKRILSTVRSYTDLEPAMLAPMEELIDFVTVDDPAMRY